MLYILITTRCKLSANDALGAALLALVFASIYEVAGR